MTPLELVALMQQRNIVMPDEFYSLDILQRQYAFTVSKLASVEQMRFVLNALAKSIKDGGTFGDFKKQIAKDGIKLPESYLDNVFRTNVQNAYSRGRWLEQQASKAERPYLQYRAINDSRVRPSHLKLDKVIRHIDDVFWQTHTPPIAYRCFLPGTKIQGDLRGAIRRKYLGVAVEITTVSGKSLRLTGNHPVLTSRGWIRADMINSGDNLLSYGNPVEAVHADVTPVQVNDNQAVASVENLFDSLWRDALTVTEGATLKLNCDFEVGDCEIDIDVANGGLVGETQSQSQTSVSEYGLVNRSDRTRLALKSIGAAYISASTFYPIDPKNAVNISGGAANKFGDSLGSQLRCGVSIKDELLQIVIRFPSGFPCSRTLPLSATRSLFNGLPLERFRLASAAHDDSLFGELSLKGAARDLGLFRYLLKAHAGVVQVDPVVNVRKFNFDGHVYDFQSNEGVLVADGIITHNCRCYTRSLSLKDAMEAGITPDDKLPQVQPDAGWTFKPSQPPEQQIIEYAEAQLSEVAAEYPAARQSIEEIRRLIRQEGDAAQETIKRLGLTDATRQTLPQMVEQAVALDVNLDPSAVTMVNEYANGTGQQLDDYINGNKNTGVGNRVMDWLKRSYDSVAKAAKQLKKKLSGNLDAPNYVFGKGQVIGINTPALFRQATKGQQVEIINARGLGIDLSKLGSDGVLLPPDLRLEVVDVKDGVVVMQPTTKAATQLFKATGGQLFAL